MDNVIVEESTDGEHKAQVEEKEALNETVGDFIVEQSTDGEHKAQVGEEEVLNETMGKDIVEECTDGEHKAQIGEEVLTETMSDVIVEESTNGIFKAQFEEGESFNGTMGNDTVEEGTDGEHKAQVEEEAATKETMGNVIVEQCTAGENMAQVSEEEALDKTMGKAIVEESSHGEHKAQIRKEEMLTETVGNVIVEENTDDEHRAQVEEGELLNETMGNVIIEQRSGGEHKTQVEEEEALNETMGNAIMEESTDGEHKAEIGEEVLTETMGNVIAVESADGEHKAQVREEEVLTEKMGVIIEESTYGEHKALVGKEESLNETMGNVIVEESTDGKHKSQDEEGGSLNETMGDVGVEESTDDEHKAQDGEEVLTETMGDVIEESTYGEHKVQVGEESLIETMDYVIAEESTDGEHTAQVGEEVLTETMDYVIAVESADGEHKAQVGKEVLTETMGNVIVEECTDGEHKAQVGEEVLTETMGNVIIKVSTDGEHQAQVGEEEAVNETEKQAVPSVASGTRINTLMENDQPVSYHLPSMDEANFSIYDVVWGKVKSHPWWPGQIFDPSDASKLAMKYQKKDSFLIAYYGDKTFAWCDESQLKPFHSYFTQLEKQCSSDTFVKSIRDILMEVSRRVELGMACSCLPEEDYTNIKYQKVENAGIRGGNINSIIDRPTIANYFQPDKLLEYIEALAQFPNGRVDKLEFVIARSQLKAFYHSKGYPELPVFTFSGGAMESVTENSPSSGNRSTEDIVEHCTPVPSDLISARGKLRSEESSVNRGDKDDVKEKSMSKLTAAGTAVHLANGGKSTSAAKVAEKPISRFSGKKHIIIESDPVDSGRCKKRMLDSFEDIEFKPPAPTVTSSFKIGEFIRRAASQLAGAPPILKFQGETLQKCGPQAEHKKDEFADFDVLPDSPVENQITNLSFTEDCNSTDEMLSQLCLAAREPMKEYSFVSTIVAFFTGFRNFCVSGSSEDKEHVEKRKRGRPRKVLSQQAASDISSSEDEKHVEKHKRDMLKNVISQLASSDVSSEDEKPVEKRKRGRPRKNPQPAPSDSSEDKKPVQKRKRGRPRGRPKKVDSHLASPDYNSSDNKKPDETRKRGRPKKVNSEIVPSGTSTPEDMIGSYWSDMDLQKKSNGKTLIQYQRKRRKSTGEQSLSVPSTSMLHIEQQLQLVAMNPHMKHTFGTERSIISVEEKILDECMPTALILSFNRTHSLPSETDLIRIFSRYGPLKEAETDVLRKTNRAKVVFKRRVDAEAAFSSAGKYSIFGPGLLSYQLKPWTPRSTLQATPQGTQDAAPITTPPDNRDEATITTRQDNHDAAFIVPPQDKHDLVLITTTQEDHDLAPITMVQDNNDAVPAIKLQDQSDSGPVVGSNFGLLEQAENVIISDNIQLEAEGKESSPHDKHHPALVASQQENEDAVPIASLLDEHDLTPTSTRDNPDAAPIIMVQDNLDAEAFIVLQDQWDAGTTEGNNLELSEQAEDVVASDTIRVEAKESSDLSPHDEHDPASIATPQENQDAVPVASPLDEHDLTRTSTQNNLEAAPITMVEEDQDTAVITLQDAITLQETCDAGHTVGRNLHLSEQAKDVIESDTVQVEAEGKESSLCDKHDPAPISTQQENQDKILVASVLHEHDLTPTSTQDNLDPAPITMDHAAAVAITLQDQCDAGPTARSNNLELSEQAQDVIASGTIPVEAEVKESSPHDKHDPAPIATPQENQDVVPITSQLDEHDLTPTSTQDNLDAAPITMVEETHNAAAIITLEDTITLQETCDAGFTVGSNLELSEDVIASDTIQVEAEGRESSPHDNHDPAPIATPQENQDAIPVASPLDEHDLTSTSTQDNLDAATITMVEENQDAVAVITLQDTITLQETCDAEPSVESNVEFSEQAEDVIGSDIVQVEAEGEQSLPQDNHNPALVTTPQQNKDAEPVDSLLDKHDLTPTTTRDNPDAVPISMPQDNDDTAPITTPQDNHNEASIATPQDNQDSEPIASLPQDNQDSEPIASPTASYSTPQDKLDLAPITMAHVCHDLSPFSTTEDNHDAAAVISQQAKCDAGPSVKSNLEISGQAEDVIASDTIHVEDECKESLPQDKHDQALIISQQNQDAEPVASLLDKHDSTPTPTQDNLDAAPITMVPDNDDAAPLTTPQDKYDVALIEGGNLDVSDQAEPRMASEIMQVEAEVGNLEVSERPETGMASDTNLS